MSYGYDYRAYDFEKAKDEALRRSIMVATIAAVIAVNSDSHTVDVQPLVKTLIDGNYESQPPLLNVPVLRHRDESGTLISPIYQIGDIGVVLFCDNDIDNVLMIRAEFEPASNRIHAMDDGIFMGVI